MSHQHPPRSHHDTHHHNEDPDHVSHEGDTDHAGHEHPDHAGHEAHGGHAGHGQGDHGDHVGQLRSLIWIMLVLGLPVVAFNPMFADRLGYQLTESSLEYGIQ